MTMRRCDVGSIRQIATPSQDLGQDHGSIVEITSEADSRIEGTFRTALADSGFYGQTVAIVGVHQGNCIGFSSVGSSATGDPEGGAAALTRELVASCHDQCRYVRTDDVGLAR
ncbi:hypothetical protein [Bradyrhizobium elkanii]|uniref:hypothetical protein n=2 Tax=Bradyrhizobium TaxID=374 RepID=UPI001FEDF860|nr:hypothetical protein [Bradyrhizobium elkanii]